MQPKKLYIETVGCQMNMLDSELVVAALRKEGYELAATAKEADTVLFNTCSVRQHAEDKIYSALGRLKHAKQQHPDKIIGVLGCMAQKDQKLIFQRAPFVDLVVGPGQLHQIPALLRDVAAGRGPQLEVSLDRTAGSRLEVADSFESYDPLRDPQMRPSPYQAFVRIMIGCDKFCTYCIVPKVRGPEQSRPPEHILSEARRLADEGCLEITLLGQTVNSYKYREADGRTVRLSDLLARLSDIPGLQRIKFVTNYPKDMTDDLLQAVRDLPKVARYLHVPAQSGSDAVLQRMKRGYTVAEYREMLQRIRETVPGAAVTSDFIVGFCGETEDDFAATVRLVEESRFKNSFIFKYSPREGAKSFDLYPDDVPEDVKKRRNNELLAIQNRISEEDNQPFVGRQVEILVEGPSKKAAKRLAAPAGFDPPAAEDDDAAAFPPHVRHGQVAAPGEEQHPAQLPILGEPCDAGADANGEHHHHDNPHHDNHHHHDHEHSHEQPHNDHHRHARGPGGQQAEEPGENACCDDDQHAAHPHDDSAHIVQLVGRTPCDRIVVFEGTRRQIGRVMDVQVYEANAFTLFGMVVTQHVGPEVYALSLGSPS